MAYLNSTEIAGKRGLIQRAVDSYRNRYPSMRSRRVARQEKLMKGTLRKRKNRESEEGQNGDGNSLPTEERLTKNFKKEETKQTIANFENDLPKTVSIDDGMGGAKSRIRINIDAVTLDSIDIHFRRANCVYPRVMDINTLSPFASQRQIEEAKCNELGWKLAWLNPKQLANRKNLLQRVLNVYRNKFLPELNPRKNSLRPTNTSSTKLTTAALTKLESHLSSKREDDESVHSETAESLECHDSFSPSAHDTNPGFSVAPSNLMLSAPTTSDQLLFGSQLQQESVIQNGRVACRRSISSSSSGASDLRSPSSEQESVFQQGELFDFYSNAIQLPSAGVDFENYDYIKTEDEGTMDPLMSQLFRL